MRSFYLKIAVIFSAILVLFGLLVGFITMKASSEIAQEAIQYTNKDIASVLAREFQPLLYETFDQEAIEEKLTKLSGQNPQFDFYLLSSSGYVKSLVPVGQERVALDNVVIDTEPLDRFINGESLPILARDPINPDRKKPFSAANVQVMDSEGCYIYVVLEGDQFSEASAMVTDSYIVRGTLMMLGVVLLISLMTGLFIFSNLSKRLKKIKKTVTGFERGKLNDRIEVQGNDELSDLSVCFNRMADTLVENMEEIKKTDKLRRELIANVSHDLRSPLASIQGYLETIQLRGDKISKTEFKKYIDTVLGNTRKLNKMIDDLFELSKLDAGNVQPNLEKVSVAELVQDLVLQLKPIADKKGVNLDAVFPENPNSLITADMSLLNRAITNLIDNAIKHTPEGGKVSIISTRNGEDVVLKVSDTGKGISAEDIPFVFDRFYQVDKSRSNGSGAGLGLAIAKKIFTLHGASLSVESPGSVDGTTFKVSIPSAKS